jgi:hypothetical protein
MTYEAEPYQRGALGNIKTLGSDLLSATLNGTLAEASKMHKTENDISQDLRPELNALMNQCPPSAVVPQLQVMQAHWVGDRTLLTN